MKGNLVFMHKLYQKVAVASVCTVLGFALGANKEAKAATFTLTPTSSFIIVDSNNDRLGDYSIDSFESLPVGRLGGSEEARAFYEFNIANLSLPYNTVISQAIFQARVDTFSGDEDSPVPQVDVYGYAANEGLDIREKFNAGVYSVGATRPYNPIISFEVASIINLTITRSNTFAGFYFKMNSRGNVSINQNATLTITTVDDAEPVPEPTTIFGSVLSLSLGAWLKRKKLSQQNRITSQN